MLAWSLYLTTWNDSYSLVLVETLCKISGCLLTLIQLVGYEWKILSSWRKPLHTILHCKLIIAHPDWVESPIEKGLSWGLGKLHQSCSIVMFKPADCFQLARCRAPGTSLRAWCFCCCNKVWRSDILTALASENVMLLSIGNLCCGHCSILTKKVENLGPVF